MKDKNYIDGYQSNDLPLFRKGRENQIKDMVEFVADFDGSHYDPKVDKQRLTQQMRGVYECICKGDWKTVEEIGTVTGYPQPSISAQLRNLRKKKFGGLDVEGRCRDGTKIFEYRLNNVETR